MSDAMCFRCANGVGGNQNYTWCQVLGMFRDWRETCDKFDDVEG